MGTTEQYRLITIPFSSYNDLARWALGRGQIPYRETKLLPFFHVAYIRWILGIRGEQDATSSPYSTPILIQNRGKAIHGSIPILKTINEMHPTPLLNTPQSDTWIRLFHDHLGVAVRTSFYFFAFRDSRILWKLFKNNVGWFQYGLFRAVHLVCAKPIDSVINPTEDTKNEAKETMFRIFDKVAATLKKQPYLLGDKLSLADVVFACLSAPLLGPTPGYGAWMPPYEEFPQEFQTYVRKLCAHPAGRWARQIYAE